MNPIAYRIAARALVADQNKSAPKKVDDLHKEVKEGNPSYSDEQAWATAWSIYCKHVDPGSDHCHEPTSEYLKQATDAAQVQTLLQRSIKHMGDIVGPRWEGFVKSHPELAKATVHMVAQDALHAMEEALKLLSAGKHAAAESSISRPTPSAEKHLPNNQFQSELLFGKIKPGSRVTIMTPHGQERSGRAVMRGPAGWVLNMGGAHGTPGIATPENIVNVK